MKALLDFVISKGGSDLHLVVNNKPVVRIDGTLFRVEKEPLLQPKDVSELIYSILTKEQATILEREKDIDFAYQISGGRFRVNVHYEKNNLALAARAIPEKIPSMEDIMLPESAYEMTRLPHGIVLVTGPTGSGKSTTLAAMINLINQERNAHIVTLEDPIEFLFKSKNCVIEQRQLHSDMVTFAQGLKHVLRQDPDVIMVGEMRDLESIATSLTLAETGHLVLATVHTYSAAQTVDRLIDVFPPHQQTQIRLQVALTLRGVLSQQLLPRVGGGRIAAREIMTNTPAIANLIRENKVPQIKSVIQTSAAQGMTTLAQDLRELIGQGLITEEIASTYVIEEGLK
ncbi:PilT/PilU family type 4a pilus ATPase [Patescibacteria group bacterium]|nr:PilT/PilU family type 4a pilus ATPase [Patescibacteria group bacterium]MBU1922403.1 PilT/PilU family type 4a pilus ATPase [Patescibacteria group bacterium]